MEQGKITLTDDEGKEIDFYILEMTELYGETYLLVTDDVESEDAEALILREIVTDDSQVVYETVEDDDTLAALSKLFEELLDEVEIKL